MSEQDAKIDKIHIAIALRKLRKQVGMSLQEVADIIGTDHSHVGRFERKGAGLGQDKLDMLPEIFGCKSKAEMVKKADALTPEQLYDDRKAIAVAVDYWCKQQNLELEYVANRIGVSNSAILRRFVKTGTLFSRERIDKLPLAFGLKVGELKKMVDAVPPEAMEEGLISLEIGFIGKEELRRHMESCKNPQKS